MSCTVAPGGVGKSSLIIAEALAMASGRKLLKVTPIRPLRVWLWNGEDPVDELERRIAAAMVYYNITSDDLGGRLSVDSGRAQPIVIADQTRDGTAIAEPVINAVKAAIRDNHIDVFSVDPFVSSHKVSENDNGRIETVAKVWVQIAEEANCAVELVHHTRKTGGLDVTVEDARGASALVFAARAARTLNAMSAAEAKKIGIKET